MNSWFIAALFSLVNFGLWGFFTKLAVMRIDVKSALVYQTLGVLLVGLFTLNTMHYKAATDMKGMSYATLTGVTYAIGCLFYFIAANKGKIITVVTLTSLYPVVTILLAFLLLKEAISFKQCTGIGCALLAIWLMSS